MTRTADLTALLDALLPGGEGFPSASAIGLAVWIDGHERFAPVVQDLLDRLPDGFATMSGDKRMRTIETVESEHSSLFGSALVAAYSGYYTHPDVLAVIEARCGYKAQPPQPGGYQLPAFDEAILALPRTRAPLWRDPAKETRP